MLFKCLFNPEKFNRLLDLCLLTQGWAFCHRQKFICDMKLGEKFDILDLGFQTQVAIFLTGFCRDSLADRQAERQINRK
jgi:hypothetical protein